MLRNHEDFFKIKCRIPADAETKLFKGIIERCHLFIVYIEVIDDFVRPLYKPHYSFRKRMSDPQASLYMRQEYSPAACDLNCQKTQ
jgi:hypothetical protein